MSINSAGFLLFLVLAAAVYYLLPKKRRWLALLAASVFFYLSYSPPAAVYLLFTILATYAAGRGLGALHRRERAELDAGAEDRSAVKKRGRRRRRLLLGSALTLNFATLALFKYLNAWLGTANRLLGLFGVSRQFQPLGLLLPLGISFYIFQTSGYLIDVYRGRAKPERNFLRYALFACWFPQMIQGPINRYAERDGLNDRMHALATGENLPLFYLRYALANPRYAFDKAAARLSDTELPQVFDVFDVPSGCYDKRLRNVEKVGDPAVYAEAYPGGYYDEAAEVLVHQAGIPVTLTIRTDSRNILVRGIPQSLYALCRQTVTERTTPEELLRMVGEEQ